MEDEDVRNGTGNGLSLSLSLAHTHTHTRTHAHSEYLSNFEGLSFSADNTHFLV